VIPSIFYYLPFFSSFYFFCLERRGHVLIIFLFRLELMYLPGKLLVSLIIIPFPLVLLAPPYKHIDIGDFVVNLEKHTRFLLRLFFYCIDIKMYGILNLRG
jgi:hypothetical protein